MTDSMFQDLRYGVRMLLKHKGHRREHGDLQRRECGAVASATV